MRLNTDHCEAGSGIVEEKIRSIQARFEFIATAGINQLTGYFVKHPYTIIGWMSDAISRVLNDHETRHRERLSHRMLGCCLPAL